jgi:secreted PhoX family phosphatase
MSAIHVAGRTATTPDDVVVAWGDRVVPEAPEFRLRQHTAKAAAGQVGFDIDVLGTLGISGSKGLWIAAHAHPHGMPPLGRTHDEREAVKISMAAHGLSVLGLRRRRRSGEWVVAEPARSPYNRRVHGGTVCKLTGPVAGDPRLRTRDGLGAGHVRGTFGHSVGTITPWGAALSGEGRFMDYFEASGTVERALAASFRRYALGGPGRGWAAVDPRFDLTLHPEEAFRFGWVVHLDPRRPASRPRKLTMLGRMGHSRIDAGIADDGRAVVRLEDGLPGGHSYVFVSRDLVDLGIGPLAGRHNRRLLTTGTLHVVPPGPVRPDIDERATWVPLVSDTTSHVPGMSVVNVLLDTRLATSRLLGPAH